MIIQTKDGSFELPNTYQVKPSITTADGEAWEIEMPCSADANIKFTPANGKKLVKLEVDGVTIPFDFVGGTYLIPISALNNSKVVFKFCDGEVFTVTLRINDGTLINAVPTITKTGDGFVDIIYNNGIFLGIMIVPYGTVISSVTINGTAQTIYNPNSMAIAYEINGQTAISINVVFV